jgi:signal recognition particle subunit SRP54
LLKGEFNLDIFYKQLKATRKMGPLGKITEMMGLNMKLPQEQLDLTEDKLDNFKFIMDSMTKQEKLDPELMNRSRIERIAVGSGKKDEDVRELLKHFKQMKKMFKKFKNLGSEKEMQKLQKKGGLQNMLGGMQKKKKKFRFK